MFSGKLAFLACKRGVAGVKWVEVVVGLRELQGLKLDEGLGT